MARSGKGSALHSQHLEAREGGFGQLGRVFLVGWFGRGKWISDCFLLSLSVNLLPQGVVGERGIHGLWHLPAGFGFCC